MSHQVLCSLAHLLVAVCPVAESCVAQVAEGLTIDCSVYHAIDGQHRQGEGEVVCALLRSTTRQATFEGSEQPGKLVFVLDNRFSWMKSKDLKLVIRQRPTAKLPATASEQEAASPTMSPTSVEVALCSTATEEAKFSLVDRMDGLVEDEVLLVTPGASPQPASAVEESGTVATDSAEQAALRRSQQLLASLDTLSAQCKEYLPSDASTYEQLQSWTDALRRLSRPYTLAFVGGFNVGKTSVINTLLRSSTTPDGTSQPLLPARMMPTTSVNVYLRHCVSAAHGEGQLSYYRVDDRLNSNQSQANVAAKQTELSEGEFRNLLDLNERAEGSSLESHASGAGGGAYSLAVEGDLFAPGCFGDYLQDRLTLIDTRGDGDVRSGTLSSTETSDGDVDEFDAVVCVLDAQRIGAEGDAKILRKASAAGKQLFVVCNKAEQLQGETDFSDALLAARNLFGAAGIRPREAGVKSGAHFISARGAVRGEERWVNALDSLVGEIRSSLDEAVSTRAVRLAELVETLEQPLSFVKRKLGFWRNLQTSESQAQRLIGRLYVEAILGNRVVSGAVEQAESARAATNSTEAAVEWLARWDIGTAVARGAVAGVGGFSTLLVAVPATVASSWLLCMRLSFAIAHLGGHDVWDPTTCNSAFACVTGEAQSHQKKALPPQQDSTTAALDSFQTFATQHGAEPLDAASASVGGVEAAVEAARLERASKLHQSSAPTESKTEDGKTIVSDVEPQAEADCSDTNSEVVAPMPVAAGIAEAAALAAARQASLNVFQAQFATQLELAAARGLSGASAQSFATMAAERSAGKALETVYQVQLAEQAGARLASAAGTRSWASVLPIVGAAITGALEGATAAAVARRAKETFIDGCAGMYDAKLCSWCGTSTSHTREASRAVGRDLYKCGGCGGKTALCIVYGCDRMAKGGTWRTDQFCKWCAEGSDVREATTLFAQTQDIYGNKRELSSSPGAGEQPTDGATAVISSVPMWSVRTGEQI